MATRAAARSSRPLQRASLAGGLLCLEPASQALDGAEGLEEGRMSSRVITRLEGRVQQEKMKACNAQAGDKKLEGDARKAFMRDCLKAGMPVSQEKMKACNKDATAKALKGEGRKAFMSTCLAGDKKS